DLDAQTNLSTMTLRRRSTDIGPLHVGDYFAKHADLIKLRKRTDWPNIDILPAHPDLRLTDLGGAAQPDTKLRFAQDVHSDSLVMPTGDHLPYDWIIIDTPPALTSHTRAAIASSHYVLAPAVADVLGVEGLRNMLQTLKAIQGLRANSVQLIGC